VRPSAAALKKLFRIALRLKGQIVAATASPRPKPALNPSPTVIYLDRLTPLGLALCEPS
jgi:hypothetical protein